MTEIAGLQQGEFNFSEPPPVGGPDLTTPSSQPAFNPVLQSLTNFERKLTDRERQFRVHADLLVASRLPKEVRPTGWPGENGRISSVTAGRTQHYREHQHGE